MNIARIYDELFRTKGALHSRSPSDTDLALLEVALGSQHTEIRLISAAICLAENSTDFRDISYQIIKEAIHTQDIGGTFCQLLFWEALLFADLSGIDSSLLRSLAQKSLNDSTVDDTNTFAVLRRIDRDRRPE